MAGSALHPWPDTLLHKNTSYPARFPLLSQKCRKQKNLPTLLSSVTPSSWCPWRRRSISGSDPRSFSDTSFQPPSSLCPDVWWPSGSFCAVSVLQPSQLKALQQKHTWGPSSCWQHIHIWSTAGLRSVWTLCFCRIKAMLLRNFNGLNLSNKSLKSSKTFRHNLMAW